MWRYLKAAFWARPELAGIGGVPWNVLALGGFVILGFGHEAFWLVGAGLEAAYLASLVSSGRFRNWVDAVAAPPPPETRPESMAIYESLTPPRRERHDALRAKVGSTLGLYRRSSTEEMLTETNSDALEKLASLHLKLLEAQQNLESMRSNPDSLTREIELVRRELSSEKITPALRESKQATLEILEKRLLNLTRREQSLQELESDLDRIEAQIDLAFENAGMSGQPEAISANIQLVSHLLDDRYES